jgi:DNA-binding response OmpR family regulator
MRRIGSSASR